MREIKFRGKAESGRWHFGDLIQSDDSGNCYIVLKLHEQDNIDYSHIIQAIKVDENTIGQYTGLKDKNGKEIWEGDVLQHRYWDVVYKYVVKFGEYDTCSDGDDNEHGYGYCIEALNGDGDNLIKLSDGDLFIVIGTIHDKEDV